MTKILAIDDNHDNLVVLQALLKTSFVKNDKQTVEQMLKATGTTVKSFTLYVVGEGIEKKVDDFAAEVAAQVAAAKQSA
jgi:elongation factor Ts